MLEINEKYIKKATDIFRGKYVRPGCLDIVVSFSGFFRTL